MGCLQMWQRARMRSWTLLERELAISRFQQRFRTARPDGLFHRSTGFVSRIACPRKRESPTNPPGLPRYLFQFSIIGRFVYSVKEYQPGRSKLELKATYSRVRAARGARPAT